VGGGGVSIRTPRSRKGRWKDVPPQEGEFPSVWIRDTLKSQQLLPFMVDPDLARTIIPLDPSEMYISTNPTQNPSWREFDAIWREKRTVGDRNPETLIERVNFNNAASKQIDALRKNATPLKCMVVYPGSADIMRASRMPANEVVIHFSVYWAILGSEAESAYLVSMLNASRLTKAFAEARGSGRSMVKSS